ncbi:fimbrial protein, partial [Cupriavidus basilensis]|nr:fimbrial protein [Cupriavidus basilensis]
MGGINAWWPQEYFFSDREIPFVGGGFFTVELVKTGPITAAGELTGEIGTTTLPSHDNKVVRRVFITGSLPIRPQVPACKVLTPSASVPLGNIPLHALKGVGTSTAARPFEIRLQCSGGT